MKAIEFSAPMMLAILRREKTMTRRKMKPQPPEFTEYVIVDEDPPHALCISQYDEHEGEWPPTVDPWRTPRYRPGDLAWVKEPLVAVVGGGWGEWTIAGYPADATIAFQSNNYANGEPIIWRWKRGTLPARYCPREASRATVRITSLKAERVQDITEEDAIREGLTDDLIREIETELGLSGCTLSATDAFSCIWEDIHGTGAWECNDWVFAYGFEIAE